MKSSSAVSSAQRPASVPRSTGMGLRYRAHADESIRPKSWPALGDQLHHRLYASSPRPSRPLGRFISNPGSVGISTGALTGSQGPRLWIIPTAQGSPRLRDDVGRGDVVRASPAAGIAWRTAGFTLSAP